MRIELKIAAFATMFFWISACDFAFYPEFISRSGDGTTEVRVMRNHPSGAGDYQFRVDVRSATGVRTVLKHDHESAIGLVEIHWEGHQKFGLLVCNEISGNLLFAYDVESSSTLADSFFESDLRRQLATKYTLGRGVDAIRWACSTEGFAEYQRRRTQYADK